MKKNIKNLSLMLLAGMALTACSGDDILDQTAQQQDNKKWTATISIGKDAGEATRAIANSGDNIIVSWATWDKVCVFKNDKMVGTLSPIESTNENTVTMSGTLDGNSWMIGETVSLRYPRQNVDYKQQSGDFGDLASKYDYAEATTTVKNVTGSTVEFNAATLVNKQALVRFEFKDPIRILTIHSSTMAEPIVIYSTRYSTLTNLYAALPLTSSGVTADYVLTGISESNKMFSIKKSGINMSNGKYYTCQIPAFANSDFPAVIDLGLSVNWATSNLEANGDVNSDGTTKSHTDITSPYGGNYYLPTKAQYEELIDNCFTRTASNFTILISKKTGYEGNTVFFRNASYWTDTPGSLGGWWYRLYISFGGFEYDEVQDGNKYSVRYVQTK